MESKDESHKASFNHSPEAKQKVEWEDSVM
jgi:hypothetical protein